MPKTHVARFSGANRLSRLLRRFELASTAQELRDDYFAGRLTREKLCYELRLLAADLHRLVLAEAN